MSSNYSKIKTISEDLNVPESVVAMVIYDYLCWSLEEILIDKKSNTIFGTLHLNKDNRLELENSKFGLIDLLDKKDIKIIRKIIEQGPDFKIFET